MTMDAVGARVCGSWMPLANTTRRFLLATIRRTGVGCQQRRAVVSWSRMRSRRGSYSPQVSCQEARSAGLMGAMGTRGALGVDLTGMFDWATRATKRGKDCDHSRTAMAFVRRLRGRIWK